VTIERRFIGARSGKAGTPDFARLRLAARSACEFAVALLFSALIACIGGGSGRRGGLPDEQLTSLPAEVKDAYDLFAVRCSRCHTLARPLNASIVNYNQWELYVARMRRHSGSGISPADADKILIFLRYYADQKAKEASAEVSP
jgi:hypothetical protein